MPSIGLGFWVTTYEERQTSHISNSQVTLANKVDDCSINSSRWLFTCAVCVMPMDLYLDENQYVNYGMDFREERNGPRMEELFYLGKNAQTNFPINT